VQRFALGGDGFRSPSGIYVVRNLRVDGDGSDAGSVSCQITLDPSYCSLIGYATMSSSQVTPLDTIVRFSMIGSQIGTMQESFEVKATDFGNPAISKLWKPPAVIIPGTDPGTLSFFGDNVATDINFFNAQIYLFDIRAREVVPIGLLVAARGGI